MRGGLPAYTGRPQQYRQETMQCLPLAPVPVLTGSAPVLLPVYNQQVGMLPMLLPLSVATSP